MPSHLQCLRSNCWALKPASDPKQAFNQNPQACIYKQAGRKPLTLSTSNANPICRRICMPPMCVLQEPVPGLNSTYGNHVLMGLSRSPLQVCARLQRNCAVSGTTPCEGYTVRGHVSATLRAIMYILHCAWCGRVKVWQGLALATAAQAWLGCGLKP